MLDSTAVAGSPVAEARRERFGGEKEDKPTVRELQILQCIADGLQNDEIAAKFFRSCKTIEKHRNNLLQKLRARGSSAFAVAIGLRKGWIK